MSFAMAGAIADRSAILRHEAVEASIAAVILLPSEPVSHGFADCITEKVPVKDRGTGGGKPVLRCDGAD